MDGGWWKLEIARGILLLGRWKLEIARGILLVGRWKLEITIGYRDGGSTSETGKMVPETEKTNRLSGHGLARWNQEPEHNT
jgi:hypothetical protein